MNNQYGKNARRPVMNQELRTNSKEAYRMWKKKQVTQEECSDIV